MKIKEVLEFVILFALTCLVLFIFKQNWLPNTTILYLVVVVTLLKSGYFIFENSMQLMEASAKNMAYHKFLLLMGYNMTQITLSFALDFYCLNEIDAKSFNGINPDFINFEKMFEFFYFSVLNFSFFGYGDITPANVPAKMTVLLEIILAFLTVIFILSDFISMKESLKSRSDL